MFKIRTQVITNGSFALRTENRKLKTISYQIIGLRVTKAFVIVAMCGV